MNWTYIPSQQCDPTSARFWRRQLYKFIIINNQNASQATALTLDVAPRLNFSQRNLAAPGISRQHDYLFCRDNDNEKDMYTDRDKDRHKRKDTVYC